MTRQELVDYIKRYQREVKFRLNRIDNYCTYIESGTCKLSNANAAYHANMEASIIAHHTQMLEKAMTEVMNDENNYNGKAEVIYLEQQNKPGAT